MAIFGKWGVERESVGVIPEFLWESPVVEVLLPSSAMRPTDRALVVRQSLDPLFPFGNTNAQILFPVQ